MKASLSTKPRSKLLKVSLAIVVIAFSFFLVRSFRTSAQTPDSQTVLTEVIIGNAAPAFTSGPEEDPASSITTPTPSGNVITFKATAKDNNGQPYFLTICSTNAITAVNGGAGTCASGAKTYCTSTQTNSETATTCTHTTSGTDVFENPWFAFVCDNDATSSSCSAGAQGTGNSGSPFVVNHIPTFSGISNNSPAVPGATVTWTATASDVDAGSTVKLLVCKTQGITGDGACSGDAWCTSTPAASNPTCDYEIPAIEADGTYDAWVYVVDQYDTPASGGSQGTKSNLVVSNVRPTVTTVSINDGNDINLTESATTNVVITATVTDPNGCSTTEVAKVEAYAYRSGNSASCGSGATGNENNCYPVTCTQDAGSCSAGSGSADYTCTAAFQYHADPTDANTQYPTENWLATVYANDEDTAAPLPSATSSQGVNVASLIAFDLGSEPKIAYGTLGTGSTTQLNQALVTKPTGNVGLDQFHKGTDMCVGYPSCITGGTPILVGAQRYGLTANAEYSTGTTLTATDVEVELNVLKVTDKSSVVTKSTYWGISIPEGILPGTYTGQNTITAVKGETANW